MLLLPLAATGASAHGVLEPLVSALAEAQDHAASLAEHAATAPPASLTAPTDDEQAAFSALIAVNEALDEIVHHSPAALHRETDTALLTELNAARDALAAYASARMGADRKAMRLAAGDAVEALGRADALLDPDKPYGILHPNRP